jgi:hypothetical protein
VIHQVTPPCGGITGRRAKGSVILVKGAMAGALAAGGLGLAVDTAHAGGGECLQYENNANYWNDQAFIAYSNYVSTNGTAGGQPAADYYYETYQDDMSTYHYWNSKFNNCNYEAP